MLPIVFTVVVKSSYEDLKTQSLTKKSWSGCWVWGRSAPCNADSCATTTNLGPRGATTQVKVCVLDSEMAVALASSPAASVRALQRCVVGKNATGCSHFMLLRASPSPSQLQSQPLKCRGACSSSRKLGGSIVGSGLQRFSIVASSMGSSTPSQVGFGRFNSVHFVWRGRQTSGSCIGNLFLNWGLCLNYFKQGVMLWVVFAAEPDELVGMV